MTNRALGTQQNDAGDGLDAHTHRMILRALYPSNGIIDGLGVSYSGGSYTVDAGDAVVGDSTDGARIAHWDGGTATGTASGSNDNIYIQALDPVKGGSQSVDTTCGVTSSAIPNGATLLATMNGSAASAIGRNAIPYGGTLGWLGGYWWQSDMVGSPVKMKKFREMQTPLRTLPTNRLIDLRFQVAYSAENASNPSEWCVQFVIDGTPIDHAVAHFRSEGTWETHEFDFTTHVSAGNHTVCIDTWLQDGSAPHFHYSPGPNEVCGYIGRRLDVYDMGVSNGRQEIGR